VDVRGRERTKVSAENRRILIIDDMASIRADFAKILGSPVEAPGLAELEHSLFGSAAPGQPTPRFELGFAAQGLEGIAEAREALARGAPYAMAFVDVRMPPGLDGIETVVRLWELDPRLEIALCTAYSDYTWQQMLERLTRPGQFLVLGKPFESTSVRQAALALTEKWNLARAAERSRDELDALVEERTRELEVANARLRTQMEERLELERRLQHAQKLEALGRLVAGVAHEINGPLCYVLANLDHMDGELGALEERWGPSARDLREANSDVIAGAKRIQQIVQDLTSFGRRDHHGIEDVRLEEVLRFALRMARPFFPAETRIDQEYRPVPTVRANAGLLSQVFVNLLANAGRALGGVPAARRAIQVRIEPEAGGGVRVTVRDQGVGIPEPALGSIFDPFFTTQAHGEGTGLGLYICHGIVQRLGGEIRIESREGEGTAAQVVLPLQPPARAVERPPVVGVMGVVRGEAA
jgi:two-component system NtrC family sensor kinase